jgi:tRNA A-37 threonylcarbamoyl transferase component Bud32
VQVPGYEILGELGRGGMGVVYKARQIKLNRLVALKMILAGGHAGEAELMRFRAEAEAIARLQHPHIVQVYEVGEHDGLPFFSLEFCEGGSLAKKLDGTPLPPREAVRLVETLAGAVQAAHQANVIHRDLNPANVLLAGGGTPKVTDFGLAKKLDEAGQTASNAIMGTPSYMAPEQAGGRSKAVGPAADVYALGAILYELLTGRPPFKAATMVDTLMQVVADEPVPPSRLQPTTPRDLETICLKCLHKEPGKRYGSAADLAADLRRFQAGEPIRARPAGRVERLAKWVRRQPAAAALLAVSVLAGMSLLGGGAYFTARLAERNERLADEVTRAERAEREARERAEDERRAREEARQLAKQEATARQQADLLAKQETAARQQADVEKRAAQYQALRAEYARHAIQVNLALSAWERHDVAEAERVLGEEAAQFQPTWEWRHLRGLCRRKALSLLGHTGEVRSVAVSADRRRIVSGGQDGTVKVWDAERAQQILTLKGHSRVAVSADGRRIVSGGGDPRDPGRPGEVKVWDGQTGPDLLTLQGHTSAVRSVAVSADGRRIVSGGQDGTVKVWDAQAGPDLLTLKGHAGPVAVSADGRRIVSEGADGTVKVWDAQTGKDLLTLQGHTGPVVSVAVSADGQRVVSGSSDKTAKVWDGQTGRDLLTLQGHTGPVVSVAVSADGQRIVSGSSDKTVKVWDGQTGRDLLTLKGHTGWVNSVAVSADGRRIVSAGRNLDRPGEVKVWGGPPADEKAKAPARP